MQNHSISTNAGPIEGIIFDIKRFALHDGDGTRTTIFFKGCPLHCTWCHNPESQEKLPGTTATGQAIGRRVKVFEVVQEIEKDTVFYDESTGGVTCSGGEPLMQPSFLAGILGACRFRGIHTALDTSGYAPPRILSAISPLVDHFLYDLKIMDEQKHIHYTGVSNQGIRENLKSLSKSGEKITVRFPLIPGITDDRQNIRDMAQFVLSLGSIEEIDLLPYHRLAAAKYKKFSLPDPIPGLVPPPAERVQEIKDQLMRYGFRVKIGG